MENTPDTLVETTSISLANQDGKCHQLSERGAALLSSMKIESESLENSQVVLILLAILEGITTNTISGDVIQLSLYHAMDTVEQLGIDEALFKDVFTRYLEVSKILRSKNPLSF